MKLDHGDSRWAPVGHIPRTDDTMDTVAWRFLASEFAGRNFRNWPIDRRLDGIVKLSEVGAVANHISLMRHI